MKDGRTLTDLAAELTRVSETARDFIAAESNLTMDDNNNLHMGDELLGVRPWAHKQIGQRLDIPAKYYDRMLQNAPALLASNVNTWLADSSDKRMVRTVDGDVRGYLSDRYRPLDNYDLASAVLPELQRAGATVESCQVTETKLYIKAVVHGREEIIAPPGVDAGALRFDGSQRHLHHIVDAVRPGITISNSEVGNGALALSPGVWTAKCTNMATWATDGLRKNHLGGALGALLQGGKDVAEYLRTDTREAMDEALWKQVRDMVHASVDGDLFTKLVDRLRETRGHVIEGDIPKVVEVTAKRFGLSDVERSGVLHHLVMGGDLTQYGLSAAVTRMCQDVPQYDRSSELEQVGARIIELPKRDWTVLAEAA